MSNSGINPLYKGNIQSFDNQIYVGKDNNVPQNKTDGQQNKNVAIKNLVNSFQPTEVKVDLPKNKVQMDGTTGDILKQVVVADKNHDKSNNVISDRIGFLNAEEMFDDEGKVRQPPVDTNSGMSILEELEADIKNAKSRTETTGTKNDDTVSNEFESDLQNARNQNGTTGTNSETRARGFTELENELKSDLKIFEQITVPKSEVNTTVTIVQIDKKATLKDKEVATDIVKKDTAPKDEEAKDLGKSGGILKSIKNFFSWLSNLFTGGKKKEETQETEPKAQSRSEKVSGGDSKSSLTETQTKVLGKVGNNIESIKSGPGDFETAYKNLTKGDKFGGDNLAYLGQGKISMSDGTFNVDGKYNYNEQQKSMRTEMISRFIDDMIPKAVNAAKNTNESNKTSEATKDRVQHWTDALSNSIEGKIRLEKNMDAIGSMLDNIIEGIDLNNNDSIKDEKVELRKLIVDLKEKYCDPKKMGEKGLREFKKDIAEQLKNTDAFFRGNTEAGTTSKTLMKLDSPNVQLKANVEMRKIIVEFAQKDFENFLSLSVSEQKKAVVSLANKFVDQYFGTTPEQNRKFATDNIGKETRAFLKDTDTEITNSTATESGKAIAKDRWNSNTFILRTLGDMVADLSVQLTREKKGLGTVLVRLQDVLTQAANNIQVKEQGKQDREFLDMPEYKVLREKLPGVLSNVVSGC